MNDGYEIPRGRGKHRRNAVRFRSHMLHQGYDFEPTLIPAELDGVVP